MFLVEKVLVGELIAMAFSIAAAAVLKYADSETIDFWCSGKNFFKDMCSYLRAVNAAFSFCVITSVFCFLCAGAVGASLVKEKLYKKLKMIVNILNVLGFIMMLIAIIIVPVMYKDANAYHKGYFEDPTKEMQAFWACAFLSMLFNSSAAGGCLKM